MTDAEKTAIEVFYTEWTGLNPNRTARRITRIYNYITETGLTLDLLRLEMHNDREWPCRNKRKQNENMAICIGTTSKSIYGCEFWWLFPKEGIMIEPKIELDQDRLPSRSDGGMFRPVGTYTPSLLDPRIVKRYLKHILDTDPWWWQCVNGDLYAGRREVRCLYCSTTQPSYDSDWKAPPADDDEEWNRLAKEHRERCTWIKSRAHQIELSCHFPGGVKDLAGLPPFD